MFLSGFFDIIFRYLRVCYYDIHTLTRGRVCNLQMLLGLASAVFLESVFRGIMIKFYCLVFEIPQSGGDLAFADGTPDIDGLCGLVVNVLGYGGPGSIPVTTRKKCSVSGTGSTQPREYN
jgi:hypothetical protein